MSGDVISLSSSSVGVKRPRSYSLSELQAKISEDSNFKDHVLHVPKLPKSKFRQIRDAYGDDVQYKLIVGQHGSEGHRQEVHAYVNCHPYLPDVRNQIQFQTRNYEKVDSIMMKEIDFIEPFKHIDHIDSKRGQEKLRFLILYCFLQRQYLNQIAFTSDGMTLLKQACASIALKAPKAGRKKRQTPQAATTDTQHISAAHAQAQLHAMCSTAPHGVDMMATIKQDPSLVDSRVDAPENDSIRALGTMVLGNDNIAKSLVEDSKTTTSTLGRPIGSVTKKKRTAMPLPRKRKRDVNEDNSKHSKRLSKDNDYEKYEEFLRLKQVDAVNERLESTNAKLVAEKAELEKDKHSLIGDKNRLQQERVSWQHEKTNMQTVLIYAQNKAFKLQRSVSTMQIERDDARQKASETVLELQQARQEFGSLKEMLRQAEHAKGEAEKRLTRIRQSLE